MNKCQKITKYKLSTSPNWYDNKKNSIFLAKILQEYDITKLRHCRNGIQKKGHRHRKKKKAPTDKS